MRRENEFVDEAWLATKKRKSAGARGSVRRQTVSLPILAFFFGEPADACQRNSFLAALSASDPDLLQPLLTKITLWPGDQLQQFDRPSSM